MIGDRYALDREIGRGGMGSVWLGTDEVLGRQVALKRIGIAPGGTTPDLHRAEREARIAASLNHPHIVGVYDLVEDDGREWLVMEYVEGASLAGLVRAEGPLPPRRLGVMLRQVAEALDAAHRAGVVHRDVKPSNILVGAGDQAKISDFGIARGEADAALTQTGLVTGSPAYLAPEVASGRQATPASDVWSLGATAYHALSGHPPYQVGDNVLGALFRIVNEPVPRLPADQAGDLARLLEASMAHDPADRWTMAQVSAELAQLSGGRRAAPPLVPPASSGEEGRTGPTRPLVAGAGSPGGEGIDIFTPSTREPDPERADPEAEPSRRRSPVLPALVGLLLIALIAAIIGLTLLDDPQRGVDQGAPSSEPSTPSGTPSGTTSSSPSPSSPTTPTSSTPTSAEMRSFVDGYLATASTDPSAGFQSLTPAYQQQSPQYAQFWGSVSNPVIVDFSADPENLTVSYTYRYRLQGQGEKTEPVSLQLVPDGDTFLIAGPV